MAVLAAWPGVIPVAAEMPVPGLAALSALVEVPKQEAQKESPEEQKRALRKAMERLVGDLDVGCLRWRI